MRFVGPSITMNFLCPFSYKWRNLVSLLIGFVILMTASVVLLDTYTTAITIEPRYYWWETYHTTEPTPLGTTRAVQVYVPAMELNVRSAEEQLSTNDTLAADAIVESVRYIKKSANKYTAKKNKTSEEQHAKVEYVRRESKLKPTSDKTRNILAKVSEPGRHILKGNIVFKGSSTKHGKAIKAHPLKDPAKLQIRVHRDPSRDTMKDKELKPQVGNSKPQFSMPDINITKVKVSSRSDFKSVDCDTTITMETHSGYDSFYDYADFAHIRFIVLTYDRAASLRKVLNSLQGVHLDGHQGSVEVWVDRSRHGDVNNTVLEVAKTFCWDRGPTRIHVHSQHVGIYGQWINTWTKPEDARAKQLNEKEKMEIRKNETLVVFLEDDVDISKYAYRWLRKAHVHYGGMANMIGYSLQSENIKIAKGLRKQNEILKRRKDLVFGFQVPGSWGFSPHPDRWREFQNWYVARYANKTFRPYVTDAELHTGWYKTFEKKHSEDTMWTMWIIRFCWEMDLFSIYSNIPSKFAGKGSLVANRKEKGLHYFVKGTAPLLLTKWSDRMIDFPDVLKVYSYEDKILKSLNISSVVS